MLSILVCHSYFLRLDQKQVARAKPYPPLATLQVVSLLREAGHRVSFFDAMLADGIEEYHQLLASQSPQLVLFYEDNFNFLSKMCLATMRRAACDMIGSARRSGARVIAAGPDVSDAPGPYLRAGADLALVGEGLSALLELLPRLDAQPHTDNEDLVRGLSGIASLSGGKVVDGSGSKGIGARRRLRVSRPGILVDIDRYRAVWMKAHGYFSLNMAASRGCSFRCTWCSKPIWGNQYLQRSPLEVAAEMAHLKRAFNPDHIWFADDIFGFRVDWVAQFAAATRAADAQIPFNIQTRADLISERMALALRDAGCQEAWIGAESGSQKILDAMNKGTTVAEILTARERLQVRGNSSRIFHPAGIHRRATRGHPGHPGFAGVRAARRDWRQRVLSSARHEILRSGQGADARQDALAGEQRLGHDVPGHLYLGFLSFDRESAARSDLDVRRAPGWRRANRFRPLPCSTAAGRIC